jgi:endo-1,4-beta-xylanase
MGWALGAGLALAATACSSSGGEAPATSLELTGPALAAAYADYFPIGAAVMAGEYGTTFTQKYNEETLSQFNSLVAENCMKPGVIQPTKGNFAWTYADSLVAYAEDHDMTVRGHVLVWHSQTPAWMFASSGTQEEKKAHARAEMLAHVNAVVGRYKDSVYCWDVVNEAISDSAGSSIYRTDSPWYQAYGDASFIADAFDYAKAADPDALLYYNDYSVVDSSKRARIVQMINDLNLKEQGLHVSESRRIGTCNGPRYRIFRRRSTPFMTWVLTYRSRARYRLLQ